ncbi:carboxypeptidase regulatory-like domain-containing protein [Hyalangium sp.]|uniref:carboxypeptidase regulatory-like domain-containing protein n=1 Tax=Hyalangium sp. TaxID=2028555 RepID=UPI00389B138B
MAVVLTAGTAGCGDLENAPFLVGTVHGQLTESDPSVAYVSVFDSPDVRGPVAADGSFTLEGVPAGKAELFIIASSSKALRQPVVVQGGQSVTVGLLTPKEASFLSVRVKAPDHQDIDGATVSVVGTPLQQLPLEEMERLNIGPLPDGCYTLGVSISGFPDVTAETCVSAGEQKEVRVNLPEPQGGCSVTGCEDDFRCAQDGRCVECLEDSQCGLGLTCRGFQCEDGPLCTPCDGDWKCHAGSTCQPLPEGGSACVVKCSQSTNCDDGFTCQSGLCLPDTAQFSGCGGYRGVGMSCDGDQHCRDLGLVNGLCLEGLCTFRCTTKAQCPAHYSCEDGVGGRVCRAEAP